MNAHPSYVAILIIALASCAGTQPLSSTPPAIEGLAHPESVTSVGGSRRLVSNIGAKLDPSAKDGDGFVSELDLAGDIVTLRAFTLLNAPKGMAVLADRLYVADIDRVVAFDIATRALLFEVRSPAANDTLLNDVAVESDDDLLVTDTIGG
jgi:hypothetical protein